MKNFKDTWKKALLICSALLIITSLIFGCGTSGGGSSNSGGGSQEENVSEKVTISGVAGIGKLSTSPDNPISFGIVEAYTKNGTLLASYPTDMNGQFSLQVTPGNDYFINVKSGDSKKIVRCYIPSVGDTGMSGIVVNAYSTAVVYVLESNLSTIFAPNQGYTGNTDLAKLSSQITTNAIYDVLVDAVQANLIVGNASQLSTEVQNIIKVFNTDSPMAMITNPDKSVAFPLVTNISFNGAGYDKKDGKLIDNSLVWTSNLDGQIGTGISFSTTVLSAGKHTITLTATDTEGLTGTATLEISVIDTSESKWVSFSYYKYYQTTPGIALRSDGTIWDVDINENSAQAIGTDRDWVQISHTLGLKNNGTLWKMRDDSRSIYDRKISPKQVGTDNNWKQITNSTTTIALKNDGTLWGWGNNSEGQLGDGTTYDKYSPIQIGSDTDWKYVMATDTKAFAIKNNGTLWGWGDTGHDVRSTDSSTQNPNITIPTQIGIDSDWQAVFPASSGRRKEESLIAKKNDGTLWDLFYNSYAGSYKYLSIGDNNWKMAALHFGIKNNGSLWDLRNTGNYGQTNPPYLIDSSNDLVTIDEISLTPSNVGNNYRLAVIKTDGTLWIYDWTPLIYKIEKIIKNQVIMK